MKNIDSCSHVRGESIYLDDIPEIKGTLYAQVFDATVAHAKIKSVDYSKALALDGIVSIITHKDIPGENQIGGIIKDEPLLAIDEVHFCGMPIAIIVATSEKVALKARKYIQIEYQQLPVIVDPREAHRQGKLIIPPRTFAIGDPTVVWENCMHIFEGRADSNGQEHLYIETQGAYAVPMENRHIKLYSSTQGPTAVQRTAAEVLGVPMHKIEVDVQRLGGGFGGKEDQATPWAVMCALAAKLLNKPVKMSLHRMDDMRMTGKRHPYSSDYKIGLSADLKIIAYEVTFYQNAGAAADLSPAVMERTLFHATNSYFIPNVRATAFSCKTNLPPNTAFRGFGGPQGMFVIESAIAHAAKKLNLPTREIQEKNLLTDGNEFPYGQVADKVQAGKAWHDAKRIYKIDELESEIEAFNAKHKYLRKGLSFMPICFGISFTNTRMNHARALVHIYQDGSIGISTGAVEMGQGVNTKMVQVATHILGVNADRIKIETTNTTRVANTSPSAASATADLNGKAVQIACNNLRERLFNCASKHLNATVDDLSVKDEWLYRSGVKSEWTWNKLVEAAFFDRIALTENGHYATPMIHFDKSKEKGHPFAYHVYGTAITSVTVDCLRGRYEVDDVNVVHDYGQSMNTNVDRGQIEGGLVQGIGWMTMEEIVFAENGKLLSNALSTYKIPDIYSVPKHIDISPLETEGHDLAILKSKAVGEPPLMYGIGAFFALQNAIHAFNPNCTLKFDAPMTPEKVLMSLTESSVPVSEEKL